MADRFAERREKLLKSLKPTEAKAILVTSEINVRYLTGFTGDSSYLLVSSDRTLLLSDSRFATQIAEECPGLEAEIRTQRKKMSEAVGEMLAKLKPGRVGFEADQLSFAAWETFRDAAGSIELTPLSGLVEELRSVKDTQEIAEIRAAVRLAERAFEAALPSMTADMTERDLSHEIEAKIRRFGGQGHAFEAIVAVGDRAALPHYRPGRRRLEESGLLLIDWGAFAQSGYRSDLTRTVATGRISAKLKKIHGIVAEALAAATAAIRPGMKAADVDAVGRGVIEQAGFGKYFGHGLGHGIGLQVHEGVRLSSISRDVLKPGQIVTVEPGIYLPGVGGVRIEDDVLVTRDGYEVLSSLPRDLQTYSLS